MPDKRSAEATARIITLLQVLADHPHHGLEASALLRLVGGYGGDHDSQKDALGRDLRHLRKAGFDIANTAKEGEEARYVLRPGDDRVRLAFSKEELFQLQRAAVLVGVDRLTSATGADTGAARAIAGAPVIAPIHVPDVLGDVQRAVATRALIRLDYSGRARTIHPYGLRIAPRGWVLEGWEQESGKAKVFSLQKMGAVRIGLPGTASPPERSSRPTMDPLRYEIDDPAEAVLQVGVRFRPQVDQVLHHPILVEPGPPAHGEQTEILHFSVTNHSNFCVRLLRLDERVVLLGGDTIRGALQRMLTQLAEVS